MGWAAADMRSKSRSNNDATARIRSRRSMERPLVLAALIILLLQLSMSRQALSPAAQYHSPPSTPATRRVQSEENIEDNSFLVEQAARLRSYNATLHPMLNVSRVRKLPVKVGFINMGPLIGTSMHVLMDGLMHSNVLDLVCTVRIYKEHNTRRRKMEEANRRKIEDLNPVNTNDWRSVRPESAKIWFIHGGHARVKNKLLNDILNPPKGTKVTWRVVVVDFQDHYNVGPFTRLRRHVRGAVRSIVEERSYDREKGIQNRGNIMRNPSNVVLCNFAVRSDIVTALEAEIQEIYSETLPAAVSSDEDYYNVNPTLHERPIDVIHLWDHANDIISGYRNEVSRIVHSWNNTLFLTTLGRTINSSTRQQGERSVRGRNMANRDYIKALTSSKIVIVVQRDGWEDHYRLFEALVCGGLVLTDAMWTLPRGYAHGVNIGVFDNTTHLEDLVRYYMDHEDERRAVAERGWKLAMRQHRSWHRLEELVFGTPITKVGLQ